MRGVIRGQGARTTFWVDGVRVSRAEFFALFPPVASQSGDGLISFKPLASDALAVHPSQVEEATLDARKKGVPTEFLPDGRPVFTSSRHFQEYARRYGFHHKEYWM
jgi:hypothetical protein